MVKNNKTLTFEIISQAPSRPLPASTATSFLAGGVLKTRKREAEGVRTRSVRKAGARRREAWGKDFPAGKYFCQGARTRK